jgi:hypothetical protein
MIASNEVEWRNLWSIAKIDTGISLPSEMAAVAVFGPGFSCPTAKFPEIVDVADASNRLLVTYRVHTTPTNLRGSVPTAFVVVRFHSDGVAERS